MSRKTFPRKRFVCLLVFAFVAAALVAPFLGGAGAQTTLPASSVLPGDLGNFAAPGRQQQLQLSKGETADFQGHLAVWADNRTTLAEGPVTYESLVAGSLTDIYAARLGADGRVIDTTPIIVTQVGFDQSMPVVGWNGQNWLVVWYHQDENDYYNYQIKAARVSPAGQLLDPTPITLDADADTATFPLSITEDGAGNWVVTWMDILPLEGTSIPRGAFATKVANDGSVVAPGTRLIYNHHHQYLDAVRLTRAGDRYLLTFYNVVAPNPFQGLTLDANFVQLRNGPEPLAQFSSAYAVATDGNTWFATSPATYNNTPGVYGVRISREGDPVDPTPVLVASNVGFSGIETSVAWDGQFWFVAYSSEVNQATQSDIYAARVTAAGQALDTAGIPVKQAAASQTKPVVAPAVGGGAQVAWSESALFDLRTARVTRQGATGTDAPLAQSAPRQSKVRTASNGNGFLAVFRSETSGVSRVMGQHLDAQGAPTGSAPFVVAESGDGPSVGWDGSNYLVVWERANKTYARAVPAGSAPVAAEFLVMDGTAPDTAGLNNQFLVVNIIQETSQIRKTQAVRVSSSGTILDPTPTRIEGVFNFAPRVAAFGDRWLAVWEYHANHDDAPGTIRGAFVTQTGGYGAPFVVGNAANDQTPHLAVSGTEAFVVWTTGDIRARRINPNGTSPDPVEGVVITNAPQRQGQPAVAWDGAQYVVVWTDQRLDGWPGQAKGDIFAARVAASTAVRIEEIAVANSPLPETTPFVSAAPAPAAGQTGLTLFTYAKFYPEAPYASHRITLRAARLAVPDLGTLPAAPSGLTVVQLNDSVGTATLRWTDNSADEVGFKVEQFTQGAWKQIGTYPANTTTVSDLLVSATLGSTFRVRAYNAAGDSAHSNEGTAPVVTVNPFTPNTYDDPATVRVQVAASDPQGVTRVEFYYTSEENPAPTLLTTDGEAPYVYDWTNVPRGRYGVRARAFDPTGSWTESASQSFTVTSEPYIKITTPAAGATFPGGSNIPIHVVASALNGNYEALTRAEVYANATLVGTVQGHYNDYDFTWINAPTGSYALTARTYTSTGLTGTSDPVQITVGAPGLNITGRVADSAGNGLYNVRVALAGSQPAETRTDAGGNYYFTNVAGGVSYTVTPTAAGYTFSPASQSFPTLSATQTANFTATPGPGVTPDPNAQAIYSQVSDGYAIEDSSKQLNGAPHDRETADDFELTASVTRVLVRGYRDWATPDNPVVRGAYLRFYDGSTGSPGALQAEYFWPAGAAGFNYNATRPADLDLTLPTPFSASGRHFISAQLLIEGSSWAVVSSNRASVRGAAWLSRDNLAGGPWAPNPVVYTPADMAFNLYGTLQSAPRIDSFTPSLAERSGIVRVSGSSFGPTKGQLKIDGKDSPFISFWSDTLIVAHVPEAATVGTVPVTVTTAGGTSASSQLNVTARQPDGRIKWRAEMAGDYMWLRPGVAPPGAEGAGTIYAASNGGYLYAWTPDGALKWVAPGVDGSGPATVGADGTIYTGTTVTENGQTGPGVAAFRPDGTLKWKFGDATGQSLRAGPNVGPDGKIYFVFRPTVDSGINLGALRPDGTLAWNVNKRYWNYADALGKELSFGRALPHLYFGFDGIMPDPSFTSGGFFAYNFDGQLVWASNRLGQGVPSIAPDEDLRLGDARVNARNGSIVYDFNFPPYNSAPDGIAEAGPDNTHFVKGRGSIYAINPNGSQKWRYDPVLPDGSFLSMESPVVNQQNTTLLVGAGGVLSQPNMFLAVDPETGAERWRQHVPVDPDPMFAPYGNVFFGERAVFSADGNTGYIAGDINGDQNLQHQQKYFYFYALDTSDSGPAPNQPPVVEMMGPINGSRFTRNINVGLAARVTDDAGVAGVDFYVTPPDGVERLVATVTKPTDPALSGIDGMYEAHYEATAPGSYRVRVVGRDSGGLSSQGAVNFTIVNEPPRINWVSPGNNSLIAPGTTTTLVAHATDPDGTITLVEFYSSAGGLDGRDTTPDANGNFSAEFANPQLGQQTLIAWATDNDGARFGSEITVTVGAPPTPTPTPTPKPVDPAAPAVAITSPASGTSYPVGTTAFFTADATPKPGKTIAGVQFIHQPWNIVLCEDVNAPYTCNFTRNQTHLYDVVAVARDSAGLSATSAPVRVYFEEARKVSISGRIRHTQSQPGNELFLPNALVTLKMNFQPYRETRTDAAGNFRFDNLSYGGAFELAPAEPGYNFYPPAVSWSGVIKDETYDFVADGPAPPGPTPTPVPGSNIQAWERLHGSASGGVVATDAQGNVYVAGTTTGAGGNSDIVTIKYTAAGQQVWAKTFAGTGNGDDLANDIAVDSSGNVYVTGYSWRGAAYFQDFVTVKYDAAGAEQWVRYLNGPKADIDIAYGLGLDSSGNVYVTGYVTSAEPATGRFFYEYATVKYDSAGTEQWVRRYSTNKYGEGHIAVGLAVDAAGNSYVTGYAWLGGTGGDTDKDVVTVKYGPAGDVLWTARFNGHATARVSDEPVAVALDPAGNVLVSGNNTPGTSREDFFVAKFDGATGAPLWSRNWAGPVSDRVRDMAVDSSGNVVLTGETFDGDFQSLSNYPTSDVATVRFDAAGNQLWAKVYRAFPGKSDTGRAVAVDSSGAAYVGAYSEGFFNSDSAVIKYAPDGTEAWVFRYDNSRHTTDSLGDLTADAAGNVYLVGTAFVQDASGNSTSYDISTVKLSPAGGPTNVPPDVTIIPAGPTIAGSPDAAGTDGGRRGAGPQGPTIAGRLVNLSAEAFDRDGTVREVSFYRSTTRQDGTVEMTLLGTDNSSPYEYAWENVEPGTYVVSATATDNTGASRTSPSVTVTVVGQPATYAITGQVTTSAGAPLAGASVALSGSASATATTGADGRYAFTGLASGGSYLLTPAMSGQTFTPASRACNNVSYDMTGQDFAASAATAAGADTVWFDDALPTGAAGFANGETWSWVTSGPAPHSGTKAHQSAVASGFHNHYFQSATQTLTVGAGDKLYAYVYLDPSNTPASIVLQWNDGAQWRNAYWGEDRVNWVGPRTRIGDVPAAGQWVRLEVPAATLGLEGKTLSGMAFNLWNGRATWDVAGKSGQATPAPTPTPTPTPAPSAEQVWVEDALPTGAVAFANGETWSWVTNNPSAYSGSSAHQSAVGTGFHNHYFTSATQTLSVGTGDVLYAYVYIDPSNVPSELMLQWNDGTTWKNAYWGTDQINWVGARVRMGDVPAPGQWTRLEVPASALGLGGKTLTGMAFNLWGGKVTWDKAGRATPSAPPPPATAEQVWVEDRLPAGAIEVGNNETWEWVTSGPVPFSGASAHRSASAAGFHNHYFHSAGESLTPGAGETLYAYVYVDPQNVPSTLMLQWHDGAEWKNAYWGADNINWVGARLRMGDVPAAGQWVRLEVPANLLGLEGKSLTGMAFNLWGGRVTWDKAGKSPAASADTVWVEDALPLGGIEAGNGETWSWVTNGPAPHSGAKAHQSAAAAGFHNHYFHSAAAPLTVGTGEVLFTYVYIDPSNVPAELMLQWNDGTTWKNAYWGTDQINWVGPRTRMGDVPAAGQWVRLEVPAATLGLEGKSLTGMAFNLWGGRVTWDKAGKGPRVP